MFPGRFEFASISTRSNDASTSPDAAGNGFSEAISRTLRSTHRRRDQSFLHFHRRRRTRPHRRHRFLAARCSSRATASAPSPPIPIAITCTASICDKTIVFDTALYAGRRAWTRRRGRKWTRARRASKRRRARHDRRSERRDPRAARRVSCTARRRVGRIERSRVGRVRDGRLCRVSFFGWKRDAAFRRGARSSRRRRAKRRALGDFVSLGGKLETRDRREGRAARRNAQADDDGVDEPDVA